MVVAAPGGPAHPAEVQGPAGHGKAVGVGPFTIVDATCNPQWYSTPRECYSSVHDLDGRWSIAAWIKPTRPQYRGQVRNSALSKHGAYDLNFENTGRVSVAVHAGAGCARHVSRSTASVPYGRWTHVAGVYTGSSLRLYVNGVLNTTIRVDRAPCASDSPLIIGGTRKYRQAGYMQNFFTGSIDDVRTYRRALSGFEVRQARDSRLAE